MKVNFKLYEENDYKDLLLMITSLYDEDPEGEQISEFKINNTIIEFQENPQKLNIYMFKNCNENIGYAILVFFWSNEFGGNIINIDELYVVEKHRGKGIATKFLYYVEGIEKIEALQLETTPSNQNALEYYKRLGFLPSENTHLIKQRLK